MIHDTRLLATRDAFYRRQPNILAAKRRDLTDAFSSQAEVSAVIATVSTVPDATGVAFIIYRARMGIDRARSTAKFQLIDFLRGQAALDKSE